VANLSTDWPFWLAATLLGLLSAFILHRALLNNRSRGRRRCPKCWYDMSGVNGLRCPECGRDAKRERRLFKTRRRWGWAAAAFAFALLSYGVWKIPEVRRRGWPRAIPTWALIAALDQLDAPTLAERDAMGKNMPVPVSAWLGWDLITRCFDNGAGMSRWERGWLISRCMASPVGTAPYGLGDDQSALGMRVFCLYSLNGWGVGEDDLLPPSVLAELRRRVGQRAVITRDRWPLGEPVRVKVVRDTWFGAGNAMFWEIRARAATPSSSDWIKRGLYGPGNIWNDGAASLGPFPKGDHRLAFELALVDTQPETAPGWPRQLVDECWEYLYEFEESKWEGVCEAPFQVGGTIDEIMTAVPNEEVAARIGSQWRFSLNRHRDMERSFDFVTLHFFDAPGQDLSNTLALIPDTTLAIWVEVFKNGELVGWTQAWWRDSVYRRGYDGLYEGVWSTELRVEVVAEGVFDPDQPDDAWTVRIYGDPTTALRDFESDRFWEGFVERPITVTPLRAAR